MSSLSSSSTVPALVAVAVATTAFFVNRARLQVVQKMAKVNKKPVAMAATDPLPPGTQNSLKVTWTPPKGTSREDVSKTILEVLNGYPKEGQNGIDGSGWRMVEDKLADPKEGSARLEYFSNTGLFAKLLNSGEPFVDDLNILIQKDEAKSVLARSASRCGIKDLGVNKKRLDYLGGELTKKGWDAPKAVYPTK